MSNGELKKLVEELSFDLQSESEESRRHALLSLTSVPSRELVVPVISKVAANDPSDQLRYIARKYLDSAAAPQEVNLTPSQIREPKTWDRCNRDEKLIIARKLVEDNCVGRLDEIILLLKKEKDAWVIASLLKVIGTLGSVNEVAVIQPYLSHSDPRVQANAVEALDAVDDDIIVPLLIPLLESNDHRICGNAVKALYRFDKDRALSYLKEKSSSEKVWYRDSALHCISVLNDPQANQMVATMYEGEFDEGLREKEKAYLEKAGMKLPQRAESSGELFDDDTLAPPELLDDELPKGGSLSSEDAAKRVSRLMSEDDEGKSVFQKLGPYIPFVGFGIGCLTLLMTGYALFFGGATDLRNLTRAVQKHLSPFMETGCSFKGTVVNFSGTVVEYSKGDLTILVEYDNRRVLLSCTTDMWPQKLSEGGKIQGSCEVTGKTRFGSIYGKATALTVQ